MKYQKEVYMRSRVCTSGIHFRQRGFYTIDKKGGWGLGTTTKYHPRGKGGTRSPPATPHRLQNPKWLPGDPKMADEVWKRCLLLARANSETGRKQGSQDAKMKASK